MRILTAVFVGIVAFSSTTFTQTLADAARLAEEAHRRAPATRLYTNDDLNKAPATTTRRSARASTSTPVGTTLIGTVPAAGDAAVLPADSWSTQFADLRSRLESDQYQLALASNVLQTLLFNVSQGPYRRSMFEPDIRRAEADVARWESVVAEDRGEMDAFRERASRAGVLLEP